MLKNLDIYFAGINRQKGEISVFLQEDIRSHVCIPLADIGFSISVNGHIIFTLSSHFKYMTMKICSLTHFKQFLIL